MSSERQRRRFADIPALLLQFYGVMLAIGLIWTGWYWNVDQTDRPDFINRELSVASAPLARQIASQIASKAGRDVTQALPEIERTLTCCFQATSGVTGVQIVDKTGAVIVNYGTRRSNDIIAEAALYVSGQDVGLVRLFVRTELDVAKRDNRMRTFGSLAVLVLFTGAALWWIVVRPFRAERRAAAILLSSAAAGDDLPELHPGEWNKPFSTLVAALMVGEAHRLQHRDEVQSYIEELKVTDFDGDMTERIALALADFD